MTYRELAEELELFKENQLDHEVMIFNLHDKGYYVLDYDYPLTFTDVDNEFGADYPCLII